MNTALSTREAMQALLDGKKLRRTGYSEGAYIHLVGDDLCNHKGHKWGCFSGLVAVDSSWYIYEEPNPHTKGTFAWAREEHKRGRKVSRGGYRSNHVREALSKPDWETWSLEDIDATDWRVVT